MRTETIIFNNLLTNQEYGRKVLAFLNQDYFSEHSDKTVFNTISSHVEKYGVFPSKEALLIDLSNRKDLDDSEFNKCKEIVVSVPQESDPLTSFDWLIDTTEAWCQDRAIHNAIFDSIRIIEGEDKTLDKGAIPKLLSDALAVSFQTDLGHDYLEDIDLRYDFYHNEEERLPFDIDRLNKITKGGIVRKSLTVLVSSTGVGKSMMMCHMAAAHLAAGRNVLYISLEMAKERIAERIDVNLMNVSFEDLKEMSREAFHKKAERIKGKTVGKLVIEEYPTSSAGAANFRYLINELKAKKGFVPDVLFVDYLNICSSSRYKPSNNANSYTIIKAIAEEVRALGSEFDMAVVTATQSTRDGAYASDIDLTNIAESFGIAHTADLILAMVSTPELEELYQLLIIQLKNRYNDLNYYKRFVVGMDRSKMRIYNIEESAQIDLMKDTNSKSDQSTSKFDKSKFEGFS